MDRLRAFEVFVTVVSRGGFARAADALDTSPANVTRYVNELEAHLGTRLLNRTSRKLSLTEGGEMLYARCKSILDDVAETEGLVSSASVEPRGRLRINAPVSFGIRHLAPLWPEFMRKYPGVELDVALIDRVVDIVDEGYDLAIRISRAGSTDHAARKLATSRNILCASPAYLARHGAPGSVDALRQHNCLLFMLGDKVHNRWRFHRGRDTVDVAVKGDRVSDDAEVVRRWALSGQGIAYKSWLDMARDVKAGRLVVLLPDWQGEAAPLNLLCPHRTLLSAAVTRLRDDLQARCNVLVEEFNRR